LTDARRLMTGVPVNLKGAVSGCVRNIRLLLVTVSGFEMIVFSLWFVRSRKDVVGEPASWLSESLPGPDGVARK